jgi:hypothetical protein
MRERSCTARHRAGQTDKAGPPFNLIRQPGVHLMILVIMYDLKSSGDLAALHQAVASLGPSAHFLTSFWLLSTDKPFTHVRDTLRARLDRQVDISITELTHRHTDYLPKDALDWLAAHRDTAGV